MLTKYIYYLIGIILLTQIRGGLLLIMPIVPFLINKIVPFTISKKILGILSILMIISTACSLLLNWVPIENVLLFYWLFIPLLVLFYAKPTSEPSSFNIEDFFHYTFRILAVVDIIGFLVWVRVGGDEFGTAYGLHYEYVHGLSLINLFYFFYYIARLKENFAFNATFYKAIFVFVSFVLCSFGLAFITLFLTVICLLLLQLNAKKLMLVVIFFVGGWGIMQSDYFTYERRNVEMVLNNSDRVRKIVMFKEVPDFLSESPLIPVVGAGPGAYNSRVAVLLSGNSVNPFTKLMGVHLPKYYKKYIYPLWNSTFVSMDTFTDGTRNKPYSSIVSILAEFGILFFFIICYSFGARIFLFDKQSKSNYLYLYLKILYVFMFLSLIIHDWIISTEFVVFLLINLLCVRKIYIK